MLIFHNLHHRIMTNLGSTCNRIPNPKVQSPALHSQNLQQQVKHTRDPDPHRAPYARRSPILPRARARARKPAPLRTPLAWRRLAFAPRRERAVWRSAQVRKENENLYDTISAHEVLSLLAPFGRVDNGDGGRGAY